MKYSHFIFDIDGTLMDTERTGMLSLKQTIKEFTGRDLPMEELLPFFGLPSAKASELLGLEKADEFARVWEEHFQELMYLVTIFPGVEDMLSSLKEAGCGLGIVTSRNRVEFGYDPNLGKIAHFFDCVVCSDDTPRPKPAPDPIIKYMEVMGAGREDCLYLGDTDHDYACAHSAGVDFALADWKGRGWQDIPASFKFSSVEEIMKNII
ncbi:MAG: HAD family hydrolase [Bacteroidales bacterium]|nr:HAD family hydrolase [Candidatus Cacconaster merdequi]